MKFNYGGRPSFLKERVDKLVVFERSELQKFLEECDKENIPFSQGIRKLLQQHLQEMDQREKQAAEQEQPQQISIFSHTLDQQEQDLQPDNENINEAIFSHLNELGQLIEQLPATTISEKRRLLPLKAMLNNFKNKVKKQSLEIYKEKNLGHLSVDKPKEDSIEVVLKKIKTDRGELEPQSQETPSEEGIYDEEKDIIQE